jgi:hypothetical protein
LNFEKLILLYFLKIIQENGKFDRKYSDSNNVMFMSKKMKRTLLVEKTGSQQKEIQSDLGLNNKALENTLNIKTVKKYTRESDPGKFNPKW